MSSSDFNEDVGYEKFAQGIYQTLLDNEEIKPTKVQHNVDIVGRSGCKHQIDVYWEYEIAGVLHRVAVECKNYNTSNVSIGRVRDFFAALTDIGNINGIFVCKNGYQSGAIKFADFYGINLKELREPKEEDWKGRIKTIEINVSIMHKDIKNRQTVFDQDWFKANYPISSEDQTYQIKGLNNQIIVKDKLGNKIASMYELDEQLPHTWEEEINKEHEYTFDDAYLDVEGIGPLKLLSIQYTYDVLFTDPDVIIISGEETAKAILKDVRTGNIKFFDKNGAVK